RPHPLSPSLFPYTTLFRSQPLLVSETGPMVHAFISWRGMKEAGGGNDPCAIPLPYLTRWTTGFVGTRFSSVPEPINTNACSIPRSEEHTSELQSLTNLVCR